MCGNVAGLDKHPSSELRGSTSSSWIYVWLKSLQALSKKAGVEFSIADISGDDLMSQKEALATQGIQVIYTT